MNSMDSNPEMLNSNDSGYIKIHKKRSSKIYGEYKPLIGKINEKSNRDHAELISAIKLGREKIE
jgi:hypothetical protein